MKRWRAGLLGALPLLFLIQESRLPSPLECALLLMAATLDAAAVRLPYFGIFSTAPSLLAVLAWRQQPLVALAAAALGLILRSLVFSGGLAACWELGARALFCWMLFAIGAPWAVVPAAVVAEGYLRLGAFVALGGKSMAQQREFQRWVRFDRYVLPHRLICYSLAPLAGLLARSAPPYLVCLAPLLFSLHRAVQGEKIRLEFRDEEQLVEEASQARQRLHQVANKLDTVQQRLRVSQQKESVFWELSLQLVECQAAEETAQRSLDYLSKRMGCDQVAFWRRSQDGLQLLAGIPPAHMEQTDPGRLFIELGEIGLLYCARSKAFSIEERELLIELAGVFTLGLQSVSLLEEQARRLASLTQSSKVAALGQLAAGLAHELNSPLAAIRLQLGLLQQRANQPDKLAASLPSALASLNGSLDQSQGLLRKLLFYSRDGVHSAVQVDLNQVIEDTLDLTRAVLANQQVKLVSRLEPLKPLEGNASDLQQALSSLLLNAKDACSQGGVVEVYSLMQGEARTILVRDNGKGIEPEILDRIFEPFFTTADPGKSAGLGLSMAQQIIHAHGGKISASNRQGGQGADFLIEL
ncbi:MAG: HAMP domain-containing histidine kinase [Candidatus Eremiobacteraeota bacterium]|nr:HAMP domain-containing histidine kinase [Candidatus Eremiobacteraeota bacterium]MCW5868687.1 HAMP domain-containing histidine kinase [Candidatus Eremiobacteraeota bacterium]